MKFITFLIITVIIIIMTPPTFALEDTGVAKIHPASPWYFLKATKENIEWKFAKTANDKDKKRLEFATSRIREVKALVGVKEELIGATLERYIAYLKNMADKGEKRGPLLLPDPKPAFILHINALIKIYNQVVLKETKTSIRSALNEFSQRLDIPASSRQMICDLFVNEASSSSLNKVEQLVLRERAIHLCSPNL